MIGAVAGTGDWLLAAPGTPAGSAVLAPPVNDLRLCSGIPSYRLTCAAAACALVGATAALRVIGAHEMGVVGANGTTVTQYAAWGGNVECVRFCASNGGGATDVKDSIFATVTQYAAWGGNVDCVRFCAASGGGVAPS